MGRQPPRGHAPYALAAAGKRVMPRTIRFRAADARLGLAAGTQTLPTRAALKTWGPRHGDAYPLCGRQETAGRVLSGYPALEAARTWYRQMVLNALCSAAPADAVRERHALDPNLVPAPGPRER
eukprot:gnl/Chilomastix_cuspidata/9709.p3 GENE.gnl/Chilomastix_cuspidata/9709~~gnl/Chilomastix_cuspidata/9709.p3  ORF type:complete len:124 (-),score=10.61 gnl/Chilomastix_cuspidata/9709:566-937(-)